MATAHPTVTYKDIPGFPGYRAGDDGSVWFSWITCRSGRRMTDRWKPMKMATTAAGYHRVNLTPVEGGKYKTFGVHRLVLLAFVGPCPDGMECRHLNGVRTDNRPGNLAWGTRQENTADRRVHANYSHRNRFITHDGKTHILKHWSVILGIPCPCLCHRLNRLGMTVQEAFTRPYRGTASNGGHWTKARKNHA